jgi:hypothetical protein
MGVWMGKSMFFLRVWGDVGTPTLPLLPVNTLLFIIIADNNLILYNLRCHAYIFYPNNQYRLQFNLSRFRCVRLPVDHNFNFLHTAYYN